MNPDFAFDADERLVAESVQKFCAARASRETLRHVQGFDRALWRAFCEQGFFALGTDQGGGGARLMAACTEALGRALFPGPIFDTILAVQVLDGNERACVIDGAAIASCGVPPTLPFACEAQLHFGLSRDRVTRLTVEGPIEEAQTLGSEPWGRAAYVVGELLPNGKRALFFFDVALAAYLTAAARGLLDVTAQHAATRKQFGRAIGSFQAVAHPLASCHIALSAAHALTRAAAAAFDEDHPRARSLATAALASSQKGALETAYTCHQKLGAIGITVEGPAHDVTRHIRQLASRAAERVSQEPALIASFGG